MRIFFVTNHLVERFSLHKYSNILLHWLAEARSYVTELIYGAEIVRQKEAAPSSKLLAERAEQEKKLLTFLKETPETIMLVTGPKGTGKSGLVHDAAKTEPYKLVINCEEFINLPDHQLLNTFAKQVGYFPVFGWLVSAGSIIDTLTASLTGTKAGFSSTTDGSVRKMLEILTIAISRLTAAEKAKLAKHVERQRAAQAANPSAPVDPLPDIEYPVIIVEGYLAKENARQQFMYDILTEWAALLAEYHIAQVVFVSNNPAALKHIGRALPTKTVENIALADASSDSALAYVRRRLGLLEAPPALVRAVDALGGRLTDLDLLIQKIHASAKSGDASAASLDQVVAASFADIVVRTVTEVRKVGLHEDAVREAGSASAAAAAAAQGWTPVQMWRIVQALAKAEEVSYDEMRTHPVFKGDEAPILAIERAGLISVSLYNGRPYSIRAGRPVYRSAFAALLADEKYAAVMSSKLAKSLIADEEAKLRHAEEELALLARVSFEGSNGAGVGRSARADLRARAEFLARAVAESQAKVAALDADDRAYKKAILAPPTPAVAAAVGAQAGLLSGLAGLFS
ncbi:mitochondrial escape protein 2 [Cladochytrium tenue]|nr:mitochondrial escape protein 2 [Cladochytrium tenue]